MNPEVKKYLQQIPKTEEKIDVPNAEESETAGPTIMFARKADLRYTSGNSIVGFWEFSPAAACISRRTSAIFVPRIKTMEDFAPCNDGKPLVRVTLG